MFLRFLLFIVVILMLLRLYRRVTTTKQGAPSEPLTDDPFEILGISNKASAEEIKSAYHRKLTEYHPDKVAHLGEDLQKLARIKTQTIISAYKEALEYRLRH